MPNRIIKETICTSDNIDSLSAFQETVFYRMIVNCDDYGRMDARPKILASKLFPLKDIRAGQMEDALRALTSAELVILYEVDGKPFLQMKTWERHQQIRAKKSKYPGPDSGKQISDSICKQMQADDSKCPRNPIQSNPNPNPNPNPSICAEASPAPAATLTLVDGSLYPITEKDAEADRKAYPAVDVMQEYLKMERWLSANPKNRKTKAGIRRFINSWLGRAQNSARPSGVKTVAAQRYKQRDYSEDDLLAVSDDLIAEARARRQA